MYCRRLCKLVGVVSRLALPQQTSATSACLCQMQTNVESKVEIGDVKDKLISAAGDGQADFLVCGSRHLGTIER